MHNSTTRLGASRRLARALLGEPLIHFLVVGLALYWAGDIYQRRHDRYRIEVSRERVGYLIETYRKQYGDAPDPKMHEVLVQNDIDNEILFREGINLKLDQNDEIVRRRVIQKMQFLAENLNAPAEPSDEAVTAYYREHPALYAAPPAATFTHVFFTDDVAALSAETRARAALVRLQKSDPSRAPDLGDRFPDRYDFAGVGAEQIERLFGRSTFSEAVFEVPVGRWSGPFRSGYGWHILKVSSRSATTLPPLAEVRDKVRGDLLAAAQDRQNQAGFQALRRRFTIVRRDTAP